MSKLKNTESILKELSAFVENGGLFDASRPPRIKEPFYKKWMRTQLQHMNLKLGDYLSVTKIDKNGNKQIIWGILIDDCAECYNAIITLMTSGEKVTKERDNRENILIGDILSIKKIADAKESFSIEEAYPDYNLYKEFAENYQKLWDYRHNNGKVRRSDKLSFFYAHPFLQFSKHEILCLEFDLEWPFNKSAIKNTHIEIKKKDGTLIAAPTTKFKNLYEFKDIFTVTEKKINSRNVLVPFKDFESLQEIECVSCTWEIELDDMRIHIMSHVYPTFEKHPKGYNIYSIFVPAVPLKMYETKSAGAFDFEKYFFTDAFITVNGTTRDIRIQKGCPTEKELENITASISTENAFTNAEITIYHQNIKSSYNYIAEENDYFKKTEEMIDFSKFLER